MKRDLFVISLGSNLWFLDYLPDARVGSYSF